MWTSWLANTIHPGRRCTQSLAGSAALRFHYARNGYPAAIFPPGKGPFLFPSPAIRYPRRPFVLAFRRRRGPIPFIDTSRLDVVERLPGWHGRYFHSPSMTFAHYDFVRGSSIHQHFHPQEEVYEVIEGELEVTIDGVAQIARPGLVAIVPPNVPHSIKALTDGRAIIVDYPLRRDFK